LSRNAPNLIPSGQNVTDTTIHLQWAISGDTPTRFDLKQDVTTVATAQYYDTEYTWTGLAPGTRYNLSVVAVFTPTAEDPTEARSANVSVRTSGVAAGGGGGGGGDGDGDGGIGPNPMFTYVSNLTVDITYPPLTVGVTYDNDAHAEKIRWFLHAEDGPVSGSRELETTWPLYKAGHHTFAIPTEYLPLGHNFGLSWTVAHAWGSTSQSYTFSLPQDPKLEELSPNEDQSHRLSKSIAEAKRKEEELRESIHVPVEEALKRRPHISP
jgi:hypothetical protein